MTMQTISTNNAPAAVGPYSQAVKAGSMLFVSGQLGLDPASMSLEEGFEAQARRALANMGAVLEAAGCVITDIAAVDVFLLDMGEFKTFNTIYSEFMGEHKPARAAVQVAGLPLGGLVEVRCTALCK